MKIIRRLQLSRLCSYLISPIVLISFFTCSAYATPVTVTFTFSGANQMFVVPVGVSSLTVDLWGAGGGGTGSSSSILGGGGAFMSGILSVTSGEVLTVIVGGGGQSGSTGGGGQGGFGGGGQGGFGTVGGGGG